MNYFQSHFPRVLLVAIEAVVLIVVSVIGFGNHGTLDVNPSVRITGFVVPLLFSWFLIGGLLGQYRYCGMGSWKTLWRPAMVAVLAVPFMAFLRAGWLGSTTISPTFILVFTILLLVVMVALRAIFTLLVQRKIVRPLN